MNREPNALNAQAESNTSPKAEYTGVSLQAWVDKHGEAFLMLATFSHLPNGVKIVGNGTLPHPLDVKLTGAYAIATELAKTMKRVESLLAAHVDHADIDMSVFAEVLEDVRELNAKANGGAL